MPGFTGSTEIRTEESRSSHPMWSDPSMYLLLSRRPPRLGINIPPMHLAGQDDIENLAPAGTQRPWEERGWVPNADEPEPDLLEFFGQSVFMRSLEMRSSIPSFPTNVMQTEHEFMRESIRVRNERALTSDTGMRVLLGESPNPGDGLESMDTIPQPWSARGYYLSADESEESEESGEFDESEDQGDENGPWAEHLSDSPEEDVLTLSHATQPVWLRNLTCQEEFVTAVPVDTSEVWSGLPATAANYSSELEVSEPVTSIDTPQIETSAPIISQTMQEISPTLQSNEGLSAEMEEMEMLAVQAIEHVCRNVNAWFQSNDSIPNHFDLHKDYVDVMLNVLQQREGFWRKAAAGCLQTQGIFWLAWILEGGCEYLPLIQLLQNEECLPPIIDELAELMGGYY